MAIKRKREALVHQHLGRVSRALLEDHSDVVRKLVGRNSGIYALYRKNRLYYVGLASSLSSRLKAHLRDQHRNSWDQFAIFLTIRDQHIREIESLLLRIARPIGNACIDGVKLEAFTTSGGLGTMCDTYLGKVANIDYKSMRYPGHMELMNFFFHELLMRDRRREAGEILVSAKPPVNEDVVYVHVAAEGTINGQLRREEFVRAYRPIEVAGGRQTAIAWTTACSVVAVIEMVRDGHLPGKGFLKQEDIQLDAFLKTRTGSYYAAA